MSRSSDLLAALGFLRTSDRLSQTAAAETFGMTRGSVSDYERGRYAPSNARAEKAFERYREENAEEATETLGTSRTTYEVMYLPTSYSPESDMDYWRGRHPHADAFFVRNLSDMTKGSWQTYARSGSEVKGIVSEAQSHNAKYRKKQVPPSVIQGVEFVAVYYR